ncbi:MAG: class I SAM-dependent methyltransferase [Polyangiaceae bacterium]|jgi:SAM-dependent methyltransferase
MLREAAHFLRYSPEALSLKASRSEVELYEAIFDRADAAGFAEERETLVSDLAGDILEVGCGTGRTFRHYGPGVRLTAIDTDDAFRAVAEKRALDARCHVRVAAASATSLPFEAESFDAVVFSLVLCSVDDVGRALSETARVLRPRGKLRALEHVRSAHPIAGAVMRALDPFWVVLNGMGCHMARDTEAAIARAGFAVEDAQRFQLFAPCLPAFPLRRITASPPARSSPPA